MTAASQRAAAPSSYVACQNMNPRPPKPKQSLATWVLTLRRCACAGSRAIAAANGTQLLLQVGGWMELAPLVGHVVPRALAAQQQGGVDRLPLSPLQDSDDVQRINSMIEVPAQLAPPVPDPGTPLPKRPSRH